MFENTDLSTLVKGNDVLAVIPLEITQELINLPLHNNVCVITDCKMMVVNICIEINADNVDDEVAMAFLSKVQFIFKRDSYYDLMVKPEVHILSKKPLMKLDKEHFKNFEGVYQVLDDDDPEHNREDYKLQLRFIHWLKDNRIVYDKYLAPAYAQQLVAVADKIKDFAFFKLEDAEILKEMLPYTNDIGTAVLMNKILHKIFVDRKDLCEFFVKDLQLFHKIAYFDFFSPLLKYPDLCGTYLSNIEAFIQRIYEEKEIDKYHVKVLSGACGCISNAVEQGCNVKKETLDLIFKIVERAAVNYRIKNPSGREACNDLAMSLSKLCSKLLCDKEQLVDSNLVALCIKAYSERESNNQMLSKLLLLVKQNVCKIDVVVQDAVAQSFLYLDTVVDKNLYKELVRGEYIFRDTFITELQNKFLNFAEITEKEQTQMLHFFLYVAEHNNVFGIRISNFLIHCVVDHHMMLANRELKIIAEHLICISKYLTGPLDTNYVNKLIALSCDTSKSPEFRGSIVRYCELLLCCGLYAELSDVIYKNSQFALYIQLYKLFYSNESIVDINLYKQDCIKLLLHGVEYYVLHANVFDGYKHLYKLFEVLVDASVVFDVAIFRYFEEILRNSGKYHCDVVLYTIQALKVSLNAGYDLSIDKFLEALNSLSKADKDRFADIIQDIVKYSDEATVSGSDVLVHKTVFEELADRNAELVSKGLS